MFSQGSLPVPLPQQPGKANTGTGSKCLLGSRPRAPCTATRTSQASHGVGMPVQKNHWKETIHHQPYSWVGSPEKLHAAPVAHDAQPRLDYKAKQSQSSQPPT